MLEPEKLRYATTHEWIALEDEGNKGTVGLSAFAIEQLTDLVYIELPEVGAPITAGESFGEIESVKAVSDLYSPVTGEILEVNTALVDALETFSTDPYGEGWIIKVRLSDPEEINDLMTAEAYKSMVE